MENETLGGEKRTPPYLPFKSFETFLSSLHGKPVPPRIDRSVMSKLSGADQSMMRVALRFFDMIEGEDSKTNDTMRRLVAAVGTESWPTALTPVVLRAYDPIVSDLDDAATLQQLQEHFRERGGLNSSALVKAVRFYITAANTAGIPLSPHFKSASAVPVSSSSDRPRRVRKSGSSNAEPSSTSQRETRLPSGVEEIVIPVPGKTVKVWLSSDLTEPEFKFALDTLRTIRKLKGS